MAGACFPPCCVPHPVEAPCGSLLMGSRYEMVEGPALRCKQPLPSPSQDREENSLPSNKIRCPQSEAAQMS